jgi:DNA polymerase-3 subunit epsilon
MNTTSNILFIDLETSGLDICYDRIVEIGLIFNQKDISLRLNPQVPISPEASKVHKIQNHDVVGCPVFADIAPKLHNLILKADYICGYNLINFDLKMLYIEFMRVGLELPKKPIIDIYQLWLRLEPTKRLTDCHKRFIGEDLKDAHTASADINSTKLILNKMLQLYNLDLNQAEFLSKYKIKQ